LHKRGVLILAAPFLIVFLVVLGGSGCQKNSLKIGILPDEEALPIYVAEQEGLFKKHGLDVELVLFESAAERDAAIQAGAVDGVEGDLIAVALMRQGGTPVKAVSIALGAKPEEGRYVLMTSPNSSIEKPEDLIGKEVAISRNTIIEFMADQMLSYKGIDPEKVNKVFVAKMPMRVEMLLQDRVAAAVLPDPLASWAEANGAKVLIDDTKLPVNLSQSVFFFREDVLQSRKEAVVGFLKAFAEGAQQVTSNPQKYRNLFIEKVRIPVELQKTFPVPTFSPPQLPTKENVQLVLNWLKEKGLLKENYGYEDLVAEEIIKVLEKER